MTNFLPVIVTPPTDPIITPAVAKAHLRVDHSSEDDLITSLVAAAVGYLDGPTGILGRALATQTWRQDFEEWDDLYLPLLPVQSVSSVKYYDVDNVLRTLDTSVYTTTTEAAGLEIDLKFGQTWPITYQREDAIQVQFVAGYGAASAVPAAIKSAILLLVGHWYFNREAVVIGTTPTELPMAVSALLAPYRRIGV